MPHLYFEHFLLNLSPHTGFDFVFSERMILPRRCAENEFLRKICRRIAIAMAALVFLILSLPANLYAQNPPIQFDRIPSVLGLSQNLVSAIMQDRKGFLWIGTKDGLNRFDGYKFTVFRHNSFDSTSLYEDRADAVWVGTRRGLSKGTSGGLLPGRTN